jgi:hypothetical protein
MLVHEDDFRGADPDDVGSERGDDRIEVPFRVRDDMCRSALPCLLGTARIRFGDDDLPAAQLERTRMDAREAELEHAAGTVSEQLEDARCGRGGESGRKPSHRPRR